MFACHGVLSVWLVHEVFDGRWPFYMMCGGLFLLTEVVLCLFIKGGLEWGRFCPSVLCYLLWLLPNTWILEEVALYERTSTGSNCTLLSGPDFVEHIGEMTPHTVVIFGKTLTANTVVENSFSIKTSRQIILLFVIVSRGLMPKGEMTHEQLSMLLMAYIGTAADITDFRAALRLEMVRCDRALYNAFLGLWSMSLLQFTVVVTPASTISHQTGLLSGYLGGDMTSEFKDELALAMSSITTQDLPFLIARVYLIIEHKVYQPSILFFMFKNLMSIVIMIFRVTMVHSAVDRREERKIEQLLLARDIIRSQDAARL